MDIEKVLFIFVLAGCIFSAILYVAFGQITVRKLEKSPLSSMHANSQVLIENTNKFDRFLRVLFYWLFMTSGLAGALLVLLNFLGIFSK